MARKLKYPGGFVLAILMVLLISSSPALADSFEEHQIKAAFLFNFPHFVKWPETTYNTALFTCNFCVLQNGAVEQALQSLIAIDENRKRLSRRYIKLSNLADLSRCDILYLRENDTEALAQVLSLVNGKNILTVSDQANFINAGGMVELVRKDTQVQVHINLDTVNKQRLDISSKLLRLATVASSEKKTQSDD